MHPDGGELSGPNEGDWQESWVVIGADTEVGDPFFVDTNDPSFPVYTAMHGMGEWSTELVSTSLSSFLESLAYLNSVGKQEHAQIDPDENTVTDPVKSTAIEKRLLEISGEKYYWQNFI